MADVWSDNEIDLIVADYFAMLGSELSGSPFSKTNHNRALQELIPRSRGSIEFKHQNISAVLLGLGQPWIDGYKPAANFQNALVDGVLRWLDSRPDWLAPKVEPVTSLVREAPSLWIGRHPRSEMNHRWSILHSWPRSAGSTTLPSAMHAIAGLGRRERN